MVFLNVPADEFFETKHYLPENTDEQRKIADFIIALDRRIEAQQSLVDNIKKYKRGSLRSAFHGNVTSLLLKPNTTKWERHCRSLCLQSGQKPRLIEE